MRIVVTGCLGFIGSAVCDRLVEHDVCGINHKDDRGRLRLSPQVDYFARLPVEHPEVSLLMGDFEPDVIIHLAASPGVRLSQYQMHRYWKNNVASLVEMLRYTPTTAHFVFASSSTVYGRNTGLFSEDDVFRAPAEHSFSPYGSTKIAGEYLVSDWARRNGARATIIRPFSVYGPNMRRDLAIYRWANQIWRGEPITVYGDGSVQRDFTYIDDVAELFVRAAVDTQARVGDCVEVYNACSQKPETMKSVIELLQGGLGKSSEIKYEAGNDLDMPVTFGNREKAKAAYNWEPEVEFAEGIRRFCEWYKEIVGRPGMENV